MTLLLALQLLILPLLCPSAVKAACTANTGVANDITPQTAVQWKWSLVAKGLTKPRSIEFDSKGRLVVVEAGKGLTAITLSSDPGVCVKESTRKTFLNFAGVGDKSTIYASTSATAYSWTYDSSAISTSNQQTLVKGMDNSDHNTRTLLKSTFQENMLLVSRGSNDNIDPGAADVNAGRSQIKAFDLSKTPSGGYDFTTTGLRLGYGLRNSVGVAEHPSTGGIYSVENSCDNLDRDGVDVHQDNPGEEMNFHGTLTNNQYAGQGKSYGYPNCFSAWDASALPNNSGFHTGTPFSNSSKFDYLCKDTNPARLTFQAHMAPLDIKFNNSGTEGWVTFHGSWDRSSPAGYKLAMIDFTSSPPGSPRMVASAQKAVFDVMTNADNSRCPGNCFRPVGIAFDKQGRLYFSSDATGEVYVVVRA